jgi:ornithine carbamoyltransferase
MRHFLDIKDFDAKTLQAILDDARALKTALRSGGTHPQPLVGRSVAMIFEKPSTRTRVSFEVGISQLGGSPIILSAGDMQLGRGETIEDSARVLSRYVDAIMIRCFSHQKLLDLALHATVPVINGLTERSHPCQIMADLQTMIDSHGPLEGQSVTWLGDGNNVLVSWIEAAALFKFELRVACPDGYSPPAELLAWAWAQGGDITLHDDPVEAARNSQTLVTDVWISMGDEEGTRMQDFAPYQVNADLMKVAAGDAVFMHCLPAIRGQEVAAEVIDGPQSVVFDEAENRLHAQKAVLAWCFAGN